MSFSISFGGDYRVTTSITPNTNKRKRIVEGIDLGEGLAM
jgi:hypothetical protein